MSLELLSIPNDYNLFINGTLSGTFTGTVNGLVLQDLLGSQISGAFIDVSPAVFSVTFSRILGGSMSSVTCRYNSPARLITNINQPLIFSVAPPTIPNYYQPSNTQTVACVCDVSGTKVMAYLKIANTSLITINPLSGVWPAGNFSMDSVSMVYSLTN